MTTTIGILRQGWTGRFCRIVEAGGFVFLSGITASDTAEDVMGQTRQVLKMIDDLLHSTGLSKAAIVTANIWLSDIEHVAAMNAAWDEWVDPENAPVRATVESKLARADLLVEIQVQAFRA